MARGMQPIPAEIKERHIKEIAALKQKHRDETAAWRKEHGAAARDKAKAVSLRKRADALIAQAAELEDLAKTPRGKRELDAAEKESVTRYAKANGEEQAAKRYGMSLREVRALTRPAK